MLNKVELQVVLNGFLACHPRRSVTGTIYKYTRTASSSILCSFREDNLSEPAWAGDIRLIHSFRWSQVLQFGGQGCNRRWRKARKITYDYLSLLSSLFSCLKWKKKKNRETEDKSMRMALWPMERKHPNPTIHSLLWSFVWNPVKPGEIYHVQIK